MSLAPRRQSTLALAAFVAPVWFTTLVVVQGLLLPDYSHVRMPISALAAWPTGWIQVLNFVATGSLMIAFAIGLNGGVRPTPLGVVGFLLLLANGIGMVMAGVFSWKMVDGVPKETPAHVAAAITTFLSIGLGLSVFSRRMRADPNWRDLSTYTLTTGIVLLVLFVALGSFAIEDGTPLHPWAGLLQRVLCAVWFTCLIVLGIRLRRVSAARGGI